MNGVQKIMTWLGTTLVAASLLPAENETKAPTTQIVNSIEEIKNEVLVESSQQPSSTETIKETYQEKVIKSKSQTSKNIVAPQEKIIVSQPVKNDCHPSYWGCLKRNAGDYDCLGGSGNGPNYTDMVRVFWYDEFWLDRDKDGWWCE